MGFLSDGDKIPQTGDLARFDRRTRFHMIPRAGPRRAQGDILPLELGLNRSTGGALIMRAYPIRRAALESKWWMSGGVTIERIAKRIQGLNLLINTRPEPTKNCFPTRQPLDFKLLFIVPSNRDTFPGPPNSICCKVNIGRRYKVLGFLSIKPLIYRISKIKDNVEGNTDVCGDNILKKLFIYTMISN